MPLLTIGMTAAVASFTEPGVHPWGPPAEVTAALTAALGQVARPVHPAGEPTRTAIGRRVGASVMLGSSAAELLVGHLRGARRVVLDPPCPMMWQEAAHAAGVPVVHRGAPRVGDVLILGRPNYPDGRSPAVAEIAALAIANPGMRVVCDETLLAYTTEPSAVPLSCVLANVTVFASLGACYGLPGLDVAWCTRVHRGHAPIATVNALALAGAVACLEHSDWPRRPALDMWRSALAERMRATEGVTQVRGAASFLLVRVGPERAAGVREALIPPYSFQSRPSAVAA